MPNTAQTNVSTPKVEIKVTTPVMNESPAQKKSLLKLNAVIDTACKMSKDTDTYIQSAAEQCLAHYIEYQDARPMDRLVKGVALAHRQPLIFWVKQNSPIFWNAKAEVKVHKPEEAAYVEPDLEVATATPYYDTAEAKARNNRVLEPLTAMTFFERIGNFERQLVNTLKEDSKREFDTSYGQPKDVEAFLADLSEFVAPYQAKAEKAHKLWLRNEQARQAAAKATRKAKKETPKAKVVDRAKVHNEVKIAA